MLEEIYRKLSDLFAHDINGYMPFDAKKLPGHQINFVPNFDPQTLYGESDGWFKSLWRSLNQNQG